MKDVYRISVAKGDGIGPEVVGAAMSVFESAVELLDAKERFEYVKVPVGWDSFNTFGEPVTEDTMDKIGETDCLILGPLDVGNYPGKSGETSPSGAIRRQFDLYANIRPVKTYIRSELKPIDLVIVRENTQGFYADRNMYHGSGEYMPTKDVALSVRVVTREKTSKISRIGFEYALKRRKKVTAVHKGNVLRVTEGLFLEEFYKEAKNFPEVNAEDRIVDSTAYDMVINPGRFDVIVTTNMFGDILSDEAAAVAGSLGVAPAINYGDSYGMAQAAHGTAPDIAGKGIANPISEILSVSMLMDWLGERNSDVMLSTISTRIRNAAEKVLEDEESLTPDLGGNGNLKTVTDRIVASL